MKVKNKSKKFFEKANICPLKFGGIDRRLVLCSQEPLIVLSDLGLFPPVLLGGPER